MVGDFAKLVKPPNHIPTAQVPCINCHVLTDMSIMAPLSAIHRNAQSTTTNCQQCHGSNSSFYSLPAINFQIVGIPANHMPTTLSCEVCHVGAGSSMASLPVQDGAKFTNSLMNHAGANTCNGCHGAGVTTFVGVDNIIVLPPVSPAGSHKPNSAVPQAYFNKLAGTQRLTTETGAGQWGTALAFACALYGLDCEVWQVGASYDAKRREACGAREGSPLTLTTSARARTECRLPRPAAAKAGPGPSRPAPPWDSEAGHRFLSGQHVELPGPVEFRDETGIVEVLHVVRAHLREVTPAIKAGKLAKARKSFEEFADNWDSIEDLIKQRSGEAYVAIEKGMIDIENALMPEKPDFDKALPRSTIERLVRADLLRLRALKVAYSVEITPAHLEAEAIEVSETTQPKQG